MLSGFIIGVLVGYFGRDYVEEVAKAVYSYILSFFQEK